MIFDDIPDIYPVVRSLEKALYYERRLGAVTLLCLTRVSIRWRDALLRGSVLDRRFWQVRAREDNCYQHLLDDGHSTLFRQLVFAEDLYPHYEYDLTLATLNGHLELAYECITRNRAHDVSELKTGSGRSSVQRTPATIYFNHYERSIAGCERNDPERTRANLQGMLDLWIMRGSVDYVYLFCLRDTQSIHNLYASINNQDSWKFARHLNQALHPRWFNSPRCTWEFIGSLNILRWMMSFIDPVSPSAYDLPLLEVARKWRVIGTDFKILCYND